MQDGYQLYHHCFFFTSDGRWSVIQQGLNEKTLYARRYHWIAELVYGKKPSFRDPARFSFAH
ncbi:MAG: hypothetical protein COX51_05205 [Syntrophobacteraceae bacterium CG23_combo_of_CG06-09_8_20_14_all_50_8]|nr:MAG: hypothetical protein COX51_05205 [Syntrophobacteraceae bacterium CG23_combo_of_CG06-09_8_20_14_all_50_8]